MKKLFFLITLLLCIFKQSSPMQDPCVIFIINDRFESFCFPPGTSILDAIHFIRSDSRYHENSMQFERQIRELVQIWNSQHSSHQLIY